MTTPMQTTTADFPPEVIDAWRADGTLADLIAAGFLVEEPTTVAVMVDREFYNPRHDKHTGQFAPKPGGGTTIGATPNRGKGNADTIAGTQPYFDTARYKGFERHAREDVPPGMKVVSSTRVAGFWEGDLEASSQVTVRGGSKGATKSYATALGKRYNQDAVVAFTPKKGGKTARYRWRVDNPEATVATMKAAGIVGATIRGKTVEVLDLDGSALPSVKTLSSKVGRPRVDRGDGALWFKGSDYADSGIMIRQMGKR